MGKDFGWIDRFPKPQPFWLFFSIFFFSCTPGSVNQQIPMGKDFRWIDRFPKPQPFWLFFSIFFSCTPGSVNQQVPMREDFLREMKWMHEVVVDESGGRPPGLLILGDHPFLNYKKKIGQRGLINTAGIINPNLALLYTYIGHIWYIYIYTAFTAFTHFASHHQN